MRDKRILLGVLLSIFAFGGLCQAASSTTSLGTNVYPDLKDRNSRFEFRATTAYDATNNRMIVGATDRGANEYAIAALTTGDSGATVTKTALAPAQIYSNPSDTSSALIANPVYSARIWELAYSSAYSRTYVTAIVQSASDTGNGGSFLAVINVADPKETYISGTAMTLENEAAGTANTASKFVKLAIGDNNAADTKIAFVAVADPVTGEFDTSKSTVGLRGFILSNSALSNNTLLEFDMLSGTGKGVKLGATASMMATNMIRLTSMVWDTTSKALYLGGHMTGGTLGICGFYVGSSDVLTSLNHGTGGTLLYNAAAASIIPDLSCIHRLVVGKLGSGGTVPHLIIEAGATPQEKNKFYVSSLMTGTAGVAGKLAQGATNSVATARSQLWIAQASNGALSSANAARGILGNAPFPLRNASTIITGMYTAATASATQNVYVTTYNAGSGSEVWVSTITHSSNYAASSTAWQNIPNTSLAKVTGFGTDATNIWAILDRKSVYVNSATATPAAVTQPSLGLANIKDMAARTRLRQVAVFDAVNRVLLTGATTTPDSNMAASHKFTIDTRANVATAEASDTNSPLYGVKIWDMAVSSTGDRYYLVNQICDFRVTGSAGGQVIVKVPADGSATRSISATNYVSPGTYTGNTVRLAFFKDGNGTPAVTKCVKILPGTNPATGLPVLFCFMQDAADGDTTYFRGNSAYDLVKVLNSDLTDPGLSCTYQSAIDGATTHHMSGNIDGIQCAAWDSTMNRLYIGAHKSSGSDPALSVLSLDSGSLTGTCAFTSGKGGSNNSIQDVYQLATMHLSTDMTTTIRSVLLVAGTISGDSTGDVAPSGVYALPLVRYGASRGNIATINALNTAVDYTITATTTDLTWNAGVNPTKFTVGGTIPWNTGAALVDMKVIGLEVYVTIANPPGVTGPCGVFRATAVCDSTNTLVGWTPWAPVSGLNSSMQNIAFDQTTGTVLGLDLASGQPIIPAWKQSSDTSSYDRLADALNTDFADQGGVYNISYHRATEGVVAANASGTGATAHLVVATGNKKVAIAHVGYKSSSASVPLVVTNPSSADTYLYKSFLNDTALQTVGQIYCSTMSRGSSGWIFVGGKNGVAALRVPGTVGGDAGKGWTSTVPSTLQDTTSSSNGLASMTWFNIPGISDSIRKMTVLYDKATGNEVVVAMGANGVYGFVANNANLFDDTTANVPSVQTLSFASERVWDIAPLYQRGGWLLVGTTKGLYRVQFDTNAWSSTTEIVDGSSVSLGSVTSIHVAAPVLAAGSDLSVNPIFTVNCVTGLPRTDAGKHYRFQITINETTPFAVASTGTVSLVRALDRMASQIISDGAVTTYHAGKPTAKPASVDVLSKSLESSSSAVSNGLTAPAGSAMGRITVVGTDGTRLVTVGGRVYVQSA